MCSIRASSCHSDSNVYVGVCSFVDHYITLRSANGTQKEHMDIAEACKKIFVEQFPTCAAALEWV